MASSGSVRVGLGEAATMDCRVQGHGGPGLDDSLGHGSSGSGRLRAEGTADQGSGQEWAQAATGLRARVAQVRL